MAGCVTMSSHAARLTRSPRLRRLLAVLERGGWFSTLDLSVMARVCAVNSAIHELRCNGADIECRCRPGSSERVYEYRLNYRLNGDSEHGERDRNRAA